MADVQINFQRVLLDVNVCIDLIVNRSILPETKKKLFAVFIQHHIEPFVPASSVDTIFYTLTSSMKIDKEVAKFRLQKLLKFTKLLHTTDESVQMAFYSGFADFEDGLINSLAECHDMDAILTNNIADFANSSLPVYRPDDFVSLFRS